MVHRHRFVIGIGAMIVLAAALALIAAGGGASLAVDSTIYVDADAPGPTHDGSSWDFAYTDLQEALTQAGIGDQIWVAAGTYKPTDGDDRTVSFAMKNNVGIYGGFDPSVGATEWEERDWANNLTVLSGNIGDEGTNADNSYHVFYHPGGLDSTAVLDGFTITGGKADGTDPHNSGGGMYNDSSSPELTDCTFTGNEASGYGGGMFNYGSSPTLTNCTLSDNAAWGGGGMFNQVSSSPTLTNCSFSGNSATSLGGGMQNTSSGPTLTNCTFTGNSAGSYGGGMDNADSSPVLTNCTFWVNTAASGGAIYNIYASSPTVTNCILYADGESEIVNSDADSMPLVAYSDIEGGCEADSYNICGDGNIDSFPEFVLTSGNDVRLLLTSPAIDAGDNGAVPTGITTDLGGNPRFAGVVDMGAYEAPPGVIYVDQDATGAGDGTSWADALVDLQDALHWAVYGVEIWVAEGTYKPTWQFDAGDPRSAAFQMKNEVAIYGGFDPSVAAVNFADRDWLLHETILSGDIGIEGNPDDNSYHVFYHPNGTDLDGTAVLNGFTITGGNADALSYPHDRGGGMFNEDYASPTLTNVTFTGNSASWGGGMCNETSSPMLDGCSFTNNSAGYDGGGIYNYQSSPTLANVTFTGNSANGYGGGIYNHIASPTLTNCTFSGNEASDDGGGIYNWESSPTLTNCTFSGNEASDDGGGIYNRESSPTLTNCILWGDTAAAVPDEIANHSGTPLVTYSDIQGGCESDPLNACGDGNIDANPLFLDPGSGDYHLGPGSPCIDAGTNDAPDLPEYDFEGDPRILDGDRDGTPVVDMGVDEWFETPPNPIFVDLEATGANDGSSWGDALTNLQAAVNWAQEGGEVWVAQGVYTPVWRFDSLDPRSASFRMKNGVAIYGGFDPSKGDTEWADRNWETNSTILGGEIGGSDLSDNSYHVLYHPPELALDNSAILDGFFIMVGYADGASWPHNEGGGMFNSASSPTLANLTFAVNWADHGGGIYNYGSSSPRLTNCTFHSNVADILGGGMLNTDSSSPTLVDCTFINNQAGEDGGGMFNNVSSSPTLTNCTFTGNTAAYGGGIYNYQSSPVLTNCALTDNRAVAGYGGGMNCDNSSPVLTNCTFARNHAAVRGGGLSNGYNSSPTLTNCTFYGNEATDSGGGIYNYQSSPALTNCILWGDTAGALPYEILNVSSSPDVTYCDIQGGYGGGGNINADPLFVDADNGDFHLGPGSPCIDTGDNYAPDLPAHDFEGDPRIIDGDSDGDPIVDMGVDEVWARVYLPVVLRGY